MKKAAFRLLFITGFVSSLLPVSFALDARRKSAASHQQSPAQEIVPPIPNDFTLIYYTDAENKLQSLPFEDVKTSVPVNPAAKSIQTGYAELKGESAATIISNTNALRFYMFITEVNDPPPPLLVRLKKKGGTRRMTAVVGRRIEGYAPVAEESVEPHYRVLEKITVHSGKLVINVNFVEMRPRTPLTPGEYAFIGTDSKVAATFRVEASK
ncbi:MAG: hypothetical protein WBP93_16305 [Pyrinomonadaceae bacterium]